MIDNELKERLLFLADKYETTDFIKDDPSFFMHQYKRITDIEIAAFTAANLAFGKRSQILLHVKTILDSALDNLTEWVLDKKYTELFTEGKKSFYRMYSHSDMILFFDVIHTMLTEYGSIGNAVKQKYNLILSSNNNYIKAYSGSPLLAPVISSFFTKDCSLIPHTKDSASKKLNMFLRWMVRDNSPVDLGIWSWYSKKDLLIPLDTHVMQMANQMKIINTKTANLKTCTLLTQAMRSIFNDDPARSDFALFGYGVNKD